MTIKQHFVSPLQSGTRSTVETGYGAMTVDAEVASFCAAEGLSRYVGLATELLRRHFPDVTEPELVHREGWGDDQPAYLGVSATASGNLDDLGERYRAFIRDWVAAVPWEVRRQIQLEIGFRSSGE